MSRTVSATFKEALFASETSQAFLILVTIDHDDLDEPILVTSDGVNTTSNGLEFIAFPFRLSLPDDTIDRMPKARLEIDNISREIVISIRSISTAPTVTLQVVLASDPDTVEASFPDFEMRNIEYDKLIVSGDLQLKDFVAEPFPAKIFSPADFPGLF